MASIEESISAAIQDGRRIFMMQDDDEVWKKAKIIGHHETKQFYSVLLGDEGVGKSSLLVQFCHNHFVEDYGFYNNINK